MHKMKKSGGIYIYISIYLSMYLLCLHYPTHIIGAGKKSQGKTLKGHNF